MSGYISTQSIVGTIVSLCLLATGGSLWLRLGRAAASACSGGAFVSSRRASKPCHSVLKCVYVQLITAVLLFWHVHAEHMREQRAGDVQLTSTSGPVADASAIVSPDA